MPIAEFLNLARVGMYFAIAMLFAFLAYAYHFGFRYMRPSPIIGAINRLFASLSALFFYYMFLPILKLTTPQVYSIATDILPLMLLPVLITAAQFWAETFKPQRLAPPKDAPTCPVKRYRGKKTL